MAADDVQADNARDRMFSRRDLIAALGSLPLWTRASFDTSFAHDSGTPQARRDETLAWLDLVTIAARVRARELSVVDLTEAYLDRIERLNPTLAAYVTTTSDRARADARRISRNQGQGASLPGVPIAHKDLFETAGIRTTAGSRLFDRHMPVRDASLVSTLAEAGTILLGKTNTHELGGGVTTINPFYGTTRNPWNTSRVAGGSSGGSAVAVAAGLAAAATGSDTGGSVRIPAAFCGCVGFKPTFGRLSTAGLLGASPTFDHCGFLTRTVADAELIYRAVVSTRPAPALRDIAITRPGREAGALAPGLRIGVARNFFFDRLQPDVARAIEQALLVFREGKAEIRDIAFPIDATSMSRVFDPIIVMEINERFGRDWRERPDAFSTSFAGIFKAPLPSPSDLAAAHRALGEYQTEVRRLFDSVDILVTPTVAITAPPIDGPFDGALILRNTWPFNAARTPALSVPCGLGADGMPIGLQLVAAPSADDLLLRAGVLYQARTDWQFRRPL